MKKFLTTSVSLFALSLSPVMAQSFSDAGTDYTNTTAEFWTEDQANDLVAMPDSFACIIKNSRGDLLPNGTWEALIDEEECFGGEGDDDGGANGSGGSTNQQASNQTEYARVKMVSERASNDVDQEITAFFESTDGGNYIASVDMNAGPSDNNPLGEWYFAFFNAGTDDAPVTVDNADNYGFVNIEENADGDVIVSAADVYDDGSFSETQASIVKYDGTNVAFAGLIDENNVGNLLAGKTNDDYYYRVQFNNVNTDGIKSGDITALGGLLTAGTTEACYERGNEWESVNRYALFNEDGSIVSMTGGFGFETTGDNPVRGYLGNWGVWLDSESVLFTPTNSSADIESYVADSDDPVSRSLNWAAGELFRVEKLTEPLANGAQFQTWRFDNQTFSFDEVYATYDSTDNEFDYTLVSNQSSGIVGTLSASAAVSAPWEAEFWSNEKQTMVRWDAQAVLDDADADQIIFTQTISVSAEDDFLDDSSLPTFKNVESNAPNGSMPLSYSDYSNDSGAGFDGTSDDETYILSGANPGTGLEARTLYLESGDAAGLDTNDDPVRFDFAMTMDYQNCSNSSCMGRYTPFTSGASAADYTSYNWPQKSVRLYDVSDADCSSDINDADCTHYEWRFGANTWDNSILAFNADNTLVTVSPPKRFSYTHAEANERNGTRTLTLQDDGGYGLTENSDNDFEVDQSTFDGNKFVMEYDGTSLHGLPATFDMTSGDWGAFVSLVNLADGTQLTDSTGSNYRVKATEVSQTFQTAPLSDCATAGVTFTDPTSLGISFDEIPDIEDETTYPRPTEAWSDAPADDALTCTVTHGDPGNCSVAAE